MKDYLKNSIVCIAGWHYFEEFYKIIAKSNIKVFVVGHRYNKILDDLRLNYAITKNIGLEYGAYDWFLKNSWDGKSNVLFMHDDVKLLEENILNDIFLMSKNFDRVYVMDKRRGKKLKRSPRCLYLSIKIIDILIEKYNGISYDKHNKGYTMGDRSLYDDYYKDGTYKERHAGKKGFKGSLDAIEEKYDLKLTKIVSDKISLYRRGNMQSLITESEDTMLNDNSIFERTDKNNLLEEITYREKMGKGRIQHYYTKWYNFYFSSIKLDNLNVLEIGVKQGKSLKMWKSYFKNSDVYGIEKNKLVIDKDVINNFTIFIGNQNDKKFLEEVCSKVPTGFDIIIDDGSHFTSDQIISFEFLFEKMNPGGIYVIEDLQTSYQKEYRCKPYKSAVDFFKKRIDDVNFNGRYKCNNYERIVKKNTKLALYEKRIQGMAFHPGICFIFKRF